MLGTGVRCGAGVSRFSVLTRGGMTSRSRARLLLYIMLIFAMMLTARPPSATAENRQRDAYIVVVSRGTDVDAVLAPYANLGAVRKRFRHVLLGASVDLDGGAADRLRRNPRVLTIERDKVWTRATAQVGAPWGLDRLDQRTPVLDGAYTYGDTGSGTTAYVVDSGIAPTYAEFGTRAAPGFDAYGSGEATDCNGHGTHVAGTIGGKLFGVAKAANIVPVRVLGCDATGTTEAILSGLEFVVQHHQSGAPAVANLSFSSSPSAAVDSAVSKVISDGVTVVVAAGNNGTDACGYSPARVGNAITVGAIDRTDGVTSWSNRGPCVDIWAPGDEIVSLGLNGVGRQDSGTSMAAPHVSGLVAAYLQRHPAATPTAVTSALNAQALNDILPTSDLFGAGNRVAHRPAKAPSSLSFTAPSVISAGEAVTVKGRLSHSSSGGPLYNRKVSMLRRPGTTGSWTTLKSKQTPYNGSVAFTSTATKTYYYRLIHAGTPTSTAVSSTIRRITYDPRWRTTIDLIKVPSTSTPYTFGQSVSIAGTLKRTFDGRVIGDGVVELLRRSGTVKQWSRVTTKRTNSSGSVSFSIPAKFNSELRLRFIGNEKHSPASTSATKHLVKYKITGSVTAPHSLNGDPLVYTHEVIKLAGRIAPVRWNMPAPELYLSDDLDDFKPWRLDDFDEWELVEGAFERSYGFDSSFLSPTKTIYGYFTVTMPGNAWNVWTTSEQELFDFSRRCDPAYDADC